MIRDRVNAAVRYVPPWSLYVVGAFPPIWIYWLGFTGQLGIDPVKEIEHQMGLWSLWLLIAGLCITPMVRIGRVSVMKYRRPLGLLAFFYLVVHLLTWAILDVQSLSRVAEDIAKRPYVTIGMAGFALLIPLALTSSDRAIRRLGPQRWRQIHWLVYPAVLLGAVHFVMLVKGWQIEPLLYLAAIIGLLLLRVRKRTFRKLLAA